MPQILRRDSDFKRVLGRGRSFLGRGVVMYTFKNRCGLLRLGVIASKKVGGAVERNRARRVIKEAFRNLVRLLPTGVDIVLIARAATINYKTIEVQREIFSHIKKAGFV
ncbi:MAG: ribonuclease P protein component [Oscillospiraceae bacterium]|jgi:ribonuclease P protein component|nr:ribonuclease P protein component [Oscillospiraceae bacterium]